MEQPAASNDIFNSLQKEMLALQGLRPIPVDEQVRIGLGSIEMAFPQKTFPRGAIHEFVSDHATNVAATNGFIAGIAGKLMQQQGICVWIGSNPCVFAPALRNYGIQPEKIIFIRVRQQKELLWTIEEALKCQSLALVVGEINEINFLQSRRLQLAVEQSRVTGFIHRYQPKAASTIACIARWQIMPLPSIAEDGMPGVGFARWRVSLLKIRNGKPGTWDIEWAANRFLDVSVQESSMDELMIRKII